MVTLKTGTIQVVIVLVLVLMLMVRINKHGSRRGDAWNKGKRKPGTSKGKQTRYRARRIVKSRKEANKV